MTFNCSVNFFIYLVKHPTILKTYCFGDLRNGSSQTVNTQFNDDHIELYNGKKEIKEALNRCSKLGAIDETERILCPDMYCV